MKYQLSDTFRKKYKKQDVRLRKAIDIALRKFVKNAFDSSLDNHSLKRELEGFRSIDITYDHRAIYEEITEDEIIFAYFERFGTHNELFRNKR